MEFHPLPFQASIIIAKNLNKLNPAMPPILSPNQKIGSLINPIDIKRLFITPFWSLNKLFQIPITVGHDKKFGRHKIIKISLLANVDFTSLSIIASKIEKGKTRQILITLMINVLDNANKNWSLLSPNNFVNCTKLQLFLKSSTRGELIAKIKSDLKAARIKIKGT